MTIRDGGPAFPMPISNGGYSVVQGMNLRTYIATKALVALIEKSEMRFNPSELTTGAFRYHFAKKLARNAYVIADEMIKTDAMLAAREVKP